MFRITIHNAFYYPTPCIYHEVIIHAFKLREYIYDHSRVIKKLLLLSLWYIWKCLPTSNITHLVVVHYSFCLLYLLTCNSKFNITNYIFRRKVHNAKFCIKLVIDLVLVYLNIIKKSQPSDITNTVIALNFEFGIIVILLGNSLYVKMLYYTKVDLNDLYRRCGNTNIISNYLFLVPIISLCLLQEEINLYISTSYVFTKFILLLIRYTYGKLVIRNLYFYLKNRNG